MAVQPDRSEPAALDPGALEALADAGRVAARGDRLADGLQAVVDVAARLTGAEVALARVVDRGRAELVVRAVAASSAALAVALDGARLPLDELPSGETGLDGAPAPLARLAEELGAGSALLIPVVVGDEVHGSLELVHIEGFDRAALAVARLAAAQVGLGIRAFGSVDITESALWDAHLFRVAGDALASGSDVANGANHVLRLALDLSGAEGALLWSLGPDGTFRRSEEAGTTEAVSHLPAPGVQELGERTSVSHKLGEPAFGILQLVFAPDRAPSAELVEVLEEFASRAARTLRAHERSSLLESELKQTRSLLAVVGQAHEELSLVVALDTAVDRVAELVESDRVAIYLLEEARLTAAVERGLAGPHVRVAEALLQLGLGPFRGRGLVAVPDVEAERRLAPVADACAEAGIEAALALPLVVAGDVIGLLAVYPARGRTLRANETELLRALSGQLAVSVQNARLHDRATRLGEELESALASERAAARQLGALYEISRAFAQSLSLDVTLDAVARTMVELLDVDVALVWMPDPRREQLIPLAFHVADERLVAPVRSILVRPQAFGRTAIQRLFLRRDSIFLDPAGAHALGGAHGLLVPFLEKGSTGAIVPIATPAEVLGALTLLSLRPDRTVSAATVEAALAIGGQAALAIDNARLYQQQKHFADAMQRSLLPQVRPAVTGLDIGEVYAASARLEVGGDLYDYIGLDDGRLAVVLGDVTGHGIDAAADMAMAKFVFRSLAREHPQPANFLAAANEVVVGEIASDKFITMLYLLIDAERGEVACASAGHPPPRHVDPDGTVHPIEARGLALGVDSGVEFEEVRTELEPAGSVVLYTDGVIEARRGMEFYGTERLDALLARRHMLRAEDIAASVIESARRFTGGELMDDCAVVVLKRQP